MSAIKKIFEIIYLKIRIFFFRLYNPIKYFIQKGKRGYSDFDLMDIDHYLLDLIPNMLEDFKNKKNGYPANLNEEEWEDILNNMITYFKNANPSMANFENPYFDEYYEKIVSPWHDNLMKDIKNNKGKSFVINMDIPEKYQDLKNNFKEKEDEEEKYRQDNLKKGFEMLLKYFHYLWY